MNKFYIIMNREKDIYYFCTTDEEKANINYSIYHMLDDKAELITAVETTDNQEIY